MRMMRAAVVLALGCGVGAVAQIPMMPGPISSNQSPSAILTQSAQIQSQMAAQSAMAQSAMARSQIAGYAAMAQGQAMSAYSIAMARQASQASMNSMNSMMAMQRSSAAMAMMNASIMAQRLRVMRSAILSLQQAGQAAGVAGATAPQTGDGAMVPPTPSVNFRPTAGVLLKVDKPGFSVPAGKVAAGTKVKLNTDTHYSTLYYTTDGWTPTTQSAKYAGPLTINETTHLQVAAIGPNMMRSAINKAEYTVEGAKAAEAKPVQIKDGVLHAGTPLRLVIAKEITSADAAVGDAVAMTLDQDVMNGDKVFAPKGTVVTAVLTNADKMGSGGPGDLVFEVQSMTVAGKVIPLIGTETMEGEQGMISKKEAVITAGMGLTVVVGADIAVK